MDNTHLDNSILECILNSGMKLEEKKELIFCLTKDRNELKTALYKKIALVMSDINYLKQDDDISFGSTKYSAISEEKVTETVRVALIKHGIIIIPAKQEHKKDAALTTLDVTWKICDNETGYFEYAMSSGTGQDSQDKGVGKASTYAYKYLLLRLFAIPTGKDEDRVSEDIFAELGNNTLDDKLKAKANSQNAEKITSDQAKNIYDMGKQKGFSDMQINKSIQSKFAVPTAFDLPAAQYDKVVSMLK